MSSRVRVFDLFMKAGRMISMKCLAGFFIFLAPIPASADTFRSDSKRFGNTKMDIVVTEVERQARTSVVDVKIKAVGSSVGSSFFLLCSLRDLARQRGGHRYIVKLEGHSGKSQMLVGFLESAEEAPQNLDARFAGQKVIDLEQFAFVCDRM